ncbi:MAG: hypothetical protein JSS02_06120 [Planctomycetes bacterium]|nr:hypothetical protein [Planctomycetota bacterium]
MDDDDLEILEAAGYPEHILEIVRRKSTEDPFDLMLHDRARNALASIGTTALQFLEDNPGMSKVELAAKLGKGVSALGLIMAVYSDAVKLGKVRDIARDLLIRQILERFPCGWSSIGPVGPLVKIGMWRSHVCDFGRDPNFCLYAKHILRDPTVDHPPADDWKPKLREDPLIDAVFERLWPR